MWFACFDGILPTASLRLPGREPPPTCKIPAAVTVPPLAESRAKVDVAIAVSEIEPSGAADAPPRAAALCDADEASDFAEDAAGGTHGRRRRRRRRHSRTAPQKALTDALLAALDERDAQLASLMESLGDAVARAAPNEPPPPPRPARAAPLGPGRFSDPGVPGLAASVRRSLAELDTLREFADAAARERDAALLREWQRRAEDEAYFSECITCCEPAPKVVLDPCEHKIMCRRCAARVRCCPVCRVEILSRDWESEDAFAQRLERKRNKQH